MPEWEFKRGILGMYRLAATMAARPIRLLRVQHGKDFTVGCSIQTLDPGVISCLGEQCGIGGVARIWNCTPIAIDEDLLAVGALIWNSGTHDPLTLHRKASVPVSVTGHARHKNVTILWRVAIGDDVVVGAGSTEDTSEWFPESATA